MRPRHAERISWAALALAALAASAAPAPASGPGLAAPVILALGLFSLGIPHGCFDHEVFRSMRERQGRPARMARFIGAYLAIAFVYAAFWFAAPLAGFVSFYLLTWFHWGMGDLDHERFVRHNPMNGRFDRGLFAFARGGLPMTLPLVADPGSVARLVECCMDLFPAGSSPLPFEPAIRFAGFAGSAAALGAACGSLARRPSTRLRHGSETVGLAALFLLLNPLVSIGLYFLLWHSARHLLRLALAFAPELRARRRHLARSGGLILAASAFLLLGAAHVATPENVKSSFALLLVFICCITLPHTLLVDWFDRAGMRILPTAGKESNPPN